MKKDPRNQVSFPVDFAYTAVNTTDTTCECYFFPVLACALSELLIRLDGFSVRRVGYVQCLWTYLAGDGSLK